MNLRRLLLICLLLAGICEGIWAETVVSTQAPTPSGALSFTPSSIVNPKDYGAKCDNATDDTTALQNAINAAQANSGAAAKIVVLPASNCRITSTLNITAGVAIVGTKYFSGIKLDTVSGGVDIIDVGFQATQISNVVLQDFTLIRVQADATGVAVNSKLIGASTYRGLYVFGNSTIGNGFNFAGIQNVGLHDVWVQNVTGYCIQAAGLNSSNASVAGPIDALGAITGGSSYTNGTYFNVALTGGSGTLALATVTVSGGAVTTVLLNPATNQGGYKPTDTLSASAASIGGTGSGFSVPVSTVGIISADLRIDNLSRCDGGAKGLIVGDWLGGVYAEGNIFYNQSTSAFSQSSTNLWRVQSSYHFVGNDVDTVPNAMLWAFGWDAHIVGNRFGFNTTQVLSFTSALDLTISGNNIIGAGATSVIDLGDGGGINIAKNVTVSGNTILGGHYAVQTERGAANVSIVGNSFSAQTSYNIGVSACNLSKITLGANSYDASIANAPIQYGCPADVNLSGNAGQKLLGQFRAANFNTTADQAIPISTQITAFQITAITVTNCSISMTTAAGGFYPTTSKGGTAIVAAGQSYSAATSASVIVNATIAATPLVTRYTIVNVYLSLTTAQGAAATCDVYIFGYDLS